MAIEPVAEAMSRRVAEVLASLPDMGDEECREAVAALAAVSLPRREPRPRLHDPAA